FSLGFSPSELILGRNIRGPLKVLNENWVEEDETAKDRKFNVGGNVLLFLPIRKFPLQAKYQGPFEILSKIGDVNYIIAKLNVVCNTVTCDGVKEDELPKHDLGELKADIKLNNSDVLSDPSSKLCHLLQDQRSDVMCLLREFQPIFGDVPQPS
ncbi:hypothetical protein Hamer_G006149, partial [Homarus americanus]